LVIEVDGRGVSNLTGVGVVARVLTCARASRGGISTLRLAMAVLEVELRKG
jgi:hypothetical protein